MRFLHTSDWHIGHRLYGRKRYQEFTLFLEWLARYIEQHPVDALLVCGDIFDSTTPGNRALSLYYGFLHRIAQSSCRTVIIIAGNHDSPTLLEAPRDLLRQINVHVIAAPRNRLEEQIMVVQGSSKADKMIVCAVPFLRDRDIRLAEAAEDMDTKSEKLTNAIGEHYRRICAVGETVRTELGGKVPLVAMGHLFTAGGKTVEGDGVRELYVGGLAHLHHSGFPAGINYLALGHLHIAQRVGGKEHYRYSGSPLPMGFNEARQQKVILDVSMDRELLEVVPVQVPCFQQLVKIEGDVNTLVQSIKELAASGSNAWLELCYNGNMESARLREKLQDAVADSSLAILRIRTAHFNAARLQQENPEEALDRLSVEEVFERCLLQSPFPPETFPELRQTFQQVITDLHQEDGEED